MLGGGTRSVRPVPPSRTTRGRRASCEASNQRNLSAPPQGGSPTLHTITTLRRGPSHRSRPFLPLPGDWAACRGRTASRQERRVGCSVDSSLYISCTQVQSLSSSALPPSAKHQHERVMDTPRASSCISEGAQKNRVVGAHRREWGCEEAHRALLYLPPVLPRGCASRVDQNQEQSGGLGSSSS